MHLNPSNYNLLNTHSCCIKCITRNAINLFICMLQLAERENNIENFEMDYIGVMVCVGSVFKFLFIFLNNFFLTILSCFMLDRGKRNLLVC